MSVEHCLVRRNTQALAQLQERPDLLHDMMDEFFSTATYLDSRDGIRASPLAVPPVVRMLYLDEFTTSLLVDFRDEGSAFFAAIAGWGGAHVVDGVRYGHGEVLYYFPEEAKEVAAKLHAYPPALLDTRFAEGADNFRLASAGYFKGDQAILAHQRQFADYVRKFYDAAAGEGDGVLLLTV